MTNRYLRKMDRFLYFRRTTPKQRKEHLEELTRDSLNRREWKETYRSMREQLKGEYAPSHLKRGHYLVASFLAVWLWYGYIFHWFFRDSAVIRALDPVALIQRLVHWIGGTDGAVDRAIQAFLSATANLEFLFALCFISVTVAELFFLATLFSRKVRVWDCWWNYGVTLIGIFPLWSFFLLVIWVFSAAGW